MATKKAKKAPLSPSRVLVELHAKSGETLQRSLTGSHTLGISDALTFVADLEKWQSALSGRAETELFKIGRQELVVATLNACEGQYRNSFKGLRLVLELYLQGVLLSTNLIALSEWMSSDSDTSWDAITSDDNGVFGNRLSRAFLPDLREQVTSFNTLARTLYRELSECTHGNIPNRVPLPTSLAYDAGALDLWINKMRTLKLVVHVALSIRYLRELPNSGKATLTPILLDEVGHVGSIRVQLGGPQAGAD